MIEGSLRNVPLADVFQIIVAGRKTGVLEVDARERRARIHFAAGRIQHASLQPGVHLGELLVRMDLLSAKEVQQILAEQAGEHARPPLGQGAVQLGLLDESELSAALTRQISEVVAELITWRDGEFRLSESSPSSSYVPTGHEVDAMMVLLEVVGRWQDARADAVEGSAVFARAGDPTAALLSDGAWDVLALIDGRRSARAVAAELELPARQTFCLLGELEELGVLERVAFPLFEEPLVLVVSPSDALQRLLRLALERAGARTSVVADRARALATARYERPKAIVLDADAGGWPAARDLRGVEGLGHVPLLLLGGATGGLFPRWRRPRADLMAKPFDELELQQWLARRLGRSLA